MTRKKYRLKIFISSVAAGMVMVAIVFLCAYLHDVYESPDDSNTYISQGTVKDIYYQHNRSSCWIVMTFDSGEKLEFAPASSRSELYENIGYDDEELASLLQGDSIEYRRMKRCPWIISISAGDIVVDCKQATASACMEARVGIMILGTIMLVFPVWGEIIYVRNIKQLYERAEKKRLRKENRRAKTNARNQRFG